MVCDRRVFKLSPRPPQHFATKIINYLCLFSVLGWGVHLCAEPVSGELPQTATPAPAHRRILPLPGAAAAASPHSSSFCPLLPAVAGSSGSVSAGSPLPSLFPLSGRCCASSKHAG